MMRYANIKKMVVLLGITLAITLIYFILPGSLPLIPKNSLQNTGNNTSAYIPSSSNIVALSYADFIKLYDFSKLFLVDAREKEDYDKGHIPGAINIPYEDAASWIDSLENMEHRPSILVSYCDGSECMASFELARQIHFLFDSTYTYHGGWEEWKSHHE